MILLLPTPPCGAWSDMKSQYMSWIFLGLHRRASVDWQFLTVCFVTLSYLVQILAGRNSFIYCRILSPHLPLLWPSHGPWQLVMSWLRRQLRLCSCLKAPLPWRWKTLLRSLNQSQFQSRVQTLLYRLHLTLQITSHLLIPFQIQILSLAFLP